MNRVQFMEQLRKLLADIPKEEREEALDYYESYFDDAGEEKEASVIRELGSPGKVAAIIKADLKESSEEYAEYTERGYEDVRMKEESQMPEVRTTGDKDGSAAQEEQRDSQESWRVRRRAQRAERGYHAGKTKNPGIVALILILLVFISPFLKGAVGGIMGVIVTIILLPFLIVFGIGAVGIGLIVGAVVTVAAAISLFATSTASGLLVLGFAFLMMAVGVLLVALIAWAAGKVLPKLLRKVTDFCYDLLHREKKGV